MEYYIDYGYLAGICNQLQQPVCLGLPKGYIDKRMGVTLRKLSNFKGQLFYFVVSEEMKRRALSKIAKAKYPIQVEIV